MEFFRSLFSPWVLLHETTSTGKWFKELLTPALSLSFLKRRYRPSGPGPFRLSG
jgi:hypothetical protein